MVLMVSMCPKTLKIRIWAPHTRGVWGIWDMPRTQTHYLREIYYESPIGCMNDKS